MKRKLFTLLTLLVLCVTGAWAEEFTIKPSLSKNNATLGYGLVTISKSGTVENCKFGSSTVQSNSSGNTFSFTIATTYAGVTIKSITFSSFSNKSSFTCTAGGPSDEITDSFTPTGDKTSATFTFVPTSSKTGKVGITSIVLDGGENDIETISAFTGKADNKFAFTTKKNGSTVSNDVTISSADATASSSNISWGNKKTITISATEIIKFVGIEADEDITKGVTTDVTTYSNTAWSGSSKSISFTNDTGGGRTIYKIYLIKEAAAPTYTVTLDKNGGSTDGSATATKGSNELTSITAPAREGYAVVGYYKEAECTNLIADAEGNLQSSTDYTDDSGNWENESAVTLYTKWTKCAQKIIYSLTADIGSAEVTTATATITAGELLSLGNTNGRIKLTALSGETFQNGDNISLAGTVGNTDDPATKYFGVKYGSTSSLGTNLYYENKINNNSTVIVNSTITLASNSDVLYIGRYDGTTTNITSLTISRAMATTSEAFTGVKKGGSALTADAGTNGYSVSTNTITLSDDITYTTTPTDIVLIKHVVFTDASENDNDVAVTFDGTITDGYFIGTANINETDYTVKVKKFVPAEPADPVVSGTTVTLTTTENMAGWRSYNNNTANKYSVDGTTKVYYVSATGDSKVTLAEIEGGVPANTAVILHKTDGTTITLTETDAEIEAPANNELKVSAANENLGKVYRLGYKSSDGVGFYTYTSASAPEGLIYVSSVSSANFLGLDFGETTDIKALDNLTISPSAHSVYDLSGRQLSNSKWSNAQMKPGLYIVNGKKVVVK